MILTLERPLPKIKKELPKLEEPWKEGDSVNCIAGYKEGTKNPYVEDLMKMTKKEQ